MVRIISDTSTMYSTKQAEEAGFSVSPLAVTIAGESYRELDEMTHERYVDLIAQGNMPKSSQPAVGEVLEQYERFAGEEMINIAMADGLSGTYSSAVSAAQMVDHPEIITVINSETLCGPHRRIVETAAKLAAKGKTREEIVSAVHVMMKNQKSFLLPSDFDYLRRGGRLSPLVSFVGKTICLVPVLTQSEDGRQLTMAGVKRNYRQAYDHAAKVFTQMGVGAGWRIYVTHAAALKLAEEAKAAMAAIFPEAEYEIHPLTPAFITQGGPGCIAIQAVKEYEEA